MEGGGLLPRVRKFPDPRYKSITFWNGQCDEYFSLIFVFLSQFSVNDKDC